jgi:hypothetical protein
MLLGRRRSPSKQHVRSPIAGECGSPPDWGRKKLPTFIRSIRDEPQSSAPHFT